MCSKPVLPVLPSAHDRMYGFTAAAAAAASSTIAEQQSFPSLTTASWESCSEEEDNTVPELPSSKPKSLSDKLGSCEEKHETSTCSDSEVCDEVSFDLFKIGTDVELSNGQR